MHTIILQEPGLFQIKEIEADFRLDADEALVKVHRIGICGTDYHAFRGKQPFFSYPRILGHELGVEVVEVGSTGSGISVGDKCSVEPYLSCGECAACKREKPNCCMNIRVLGVHTDGGMSEYIKVPTNKLHPSRKLSFDQLALIETLAIGAHAVDRAKIEATDVVLVIGAGPIGLSLIQFVKISGAKLLVLDMNEDRLQFCMDTFKVEAAIHAKENPLDEIKQALGGDLPTVVFDATGNPASMMSSFGYIAHGGRLVFVGLFSGDVTFHDPDFHRREMTLLASRNALSKDFKNIISLMEEGKIDTCPWITHRCSFTDMPNQFNSWLHPDEKVIKAIVEVG